jgi:hypothetical protein
VWLRELDAHFVGRFTVPYPNTHNHGKFNVIIYIM